MKFIILQDIPYRRPEGALAQYHGAIWAEELRRRGHEATKMVIGDPNAISPKSPLLSLSTSEQRRDPAFWREQDADCVLFYAGPSVGCVDVVRAIKKGSPRTKVVSRIEAYWAPRKQTPRSLVRAFRECYANKRHCPTERFDFEKRAILPALLRTVAATSRLWLRPSGNALIQLVEASDRTTFFFPRLVEETKKFLRESNRPDLLDRIVWSGYPVRPEFRPPEPGGKQPGSVISIANWRHFKDPELTADATSIVLRNDPQASFTVIGQKSDRVANRILASVPDAAPRLHSFDHVDNWRIPELLARAQVFLLCSYREGIPSVLSEALCCGCSLALSAGPAVGAFRDYLDHEDGTQAASRRPRDMADAVLSELAQWRLNNRNSFDISKRWSGTIVSSLCDELIQFVQP